MLTSLLPLLRQQDGVVARRQLVDLGLDDNDIETFVRRRHLTRVASGVYVDHTGEPTWRQQVWAGTLRFAPAAAAGRTALALVGLVPPAKVVDVLVSHDRRLRGSQHGVRVRRSRDFGHAALLGLHPPRVRVEHAVVAVTAAAAASTLDSVALIGDAVQARLTTADRLLAQLNATARHPNRRMVRRVLEDASAGVCSALEHHYVTRVERPHGLPTARRQVRTRIAGHTTYRDVEYLGGLLVVELDGRIGHELSRDRWADAARDIRTLLHGGHTVRLTWGQVLEPCRSAAVVAQLLTALGWSGSPRPCSSEACSVGR